jgi:hypothetical protein
VPVPVATNPAHLTHVEDPAVPAKVVVQQPITVIEGNVTVPELTAAEKARLVAEVKAERAPKHHHEFKNVE